MAIRQSNSFNCNDQAAIHKIKLELVKDSYLYSLLPYTTQEDIQDNEYYVLHYYSNSQLEFHGVYDYVRNYNTDIIKTIIDNSVLSIVNKTAIKLFGSDYTISNNEPNCSATNLVLKEMLKTAISNTRTTFIFSE